MSGQAKDPEPTSDEIEIGLQLDRLRTPDIIAFVQGLPRRAREQLFALDDDAGKDTAGKDNAINSRLNDIVVGLDTLIQELVKTGYAPDTSRAMPTRWVELDRPAIREPLARLDAGATEAAQRLVGLPTPAWASHPELIDVARATVADAARSLRLLPGGSAAESGADRDS